MAHRYEVSMNWGGKEAIGKLVVGGQLADENETAVLAGRAEIASRILAPLQVGIEHRYVFGNRKLAALPLPEKVPAERELLLAEPVGKESVLADALESRGKCIGSAGTEVPPHWFEVPLYAC